MWLHARQKRRPFVDLIEGVGADHKALRVAGDQRLGKGEQRLAGAVDRNNVAADIQAAGSQRKALGQPVGNALTQFGLALGSRIDRCLVEVVGQCLQYERR